MIVTIGASDWLNFAINAGLPALVALVTARLAHPGLKAVVLLFLSAVSGFLTSWLAACATICAAFDWPHTVFSVLSGFAVAVLVHFGLLSPLAITGSGGAIQTAVPSGIGGNPGPLADHTLGS